MTSTRALKTRVEALFVGGPAPLGDNGEASAIRKQPIDGPCRLSAEGLAGDAVADHRHHGGPERALNHFPAEHYAGWRERYPEIAERMTAGGVGENLSATGITEADVHVGDRFTLGGATLELAQPRQPCWKPGARLGPQDLMKHMIARGEAGWFYRVLEPGEVRVGDTLERIAVAEHGIDLAELWRLIGLRRASAAEREAMQRLAGLEAMASEWRQRFARQADQVGRG